ncbi:putative TonB family protein [Syntrophobacter sp. SbD1]|nr:putative TonB family protein [Syntrophobacter sp. SbD1]
MEPFALADKRIAGKELATGLGASILVHVLVFSFAFIWALVMPHKPLLPPFCTVNLVSLKDLGIGSSEPKGSPKAAEQAEPSRNAASSAKVHQKAEPVIPIKRLKVDEAAIKPETQIKKIEPKEAPVAPEKPQSLEAIEKNLDKLIARPKAVPQTSTASAQHSEPQPKASAQPPPAPSPAKSQPGNEKLARGTPTGTAEGGAKGASQGSTFGSPEGSGALSAASQLYYERVRNAIRQEFKLPDQIVGNPETIALIVVSRNGEVLSLQIEKSSGNGLLDAAAVRAIQNANIPAMPAVMERPKEEFTVKFNSRGLS